MSSERDEIMARVRSALSPLPERAALPEWETALVRLRQTTSSGDLWSVFAKRLAAVNGTPINSITELVTLLDSKGWRRGYCDPKLWPEIKDAFPGTFTVETTFDRSRVDDYDFGITAATAAIAETGTLILSDGVTSTRLGALAPWVHVAVVRPDQIHPDIPAALESLPADPNIVWVTGPSKTADVEGILIEGVHGPGLQVALLLSS